MVNKINKVSRRTAEETHKIEDIASNLFIPLRSGGLLRVGSRRQRERRPSST
jgi:hypothetical protein